jgi:Zn-dependent M16 (insulinase) family peptidase
MSALKSAHLHTVGQIYHDFQLTQSAEIPEIHCHLYELVHLPTQAHVMHLANDDPENLFCLSFQTLPEKSNGVAHILEHTVLCGSKKYPVKDPFFAMTRRSLHTFMNALTGSDFTCYPASSQVAKDFYNLLEVYLDAVFHPQLNPLSFLQEGHRLEFADPINPSSPLEHKGVVYNEMKGALSSPSARLSEAVHAALFPNITYGINSGGNPHDITTLTYEELRNFHTKFYHPSRCLFFFYGNLPLEPHLDFIAEHALKGVQKVPPLPPIPFQPRFIQPRYVTTSYPIDPKEEVKDKAFIAFAWLTSHVMEQEELLALSILEIILLDTDASPLKMALMRSGLCKLVSSHIDNDINENPLMITVRGCDPDHAEDLQNLIYQTLKEIANQGIPLDQVENAMHQLEFFRSEITGDHAPFGLSLFMRSALLKQHKVAPQEGLKIHSLFDALHQKILQNPHYLSEFLQKHLIDNPHFVRVTMHPDKTLAAKELVEERENLDKIRAQLTDKQIKHLIKQASDLKTFQKKQEEVDLDILPKVSLEDIPKISRDFPLLHEKIENIEVFHHTCFTNKIVYADLVFNLPALPEVEMPIVRLFTYLMPQLGCGGRTYIENLDYIQAHTGGVGVSLVHNVQAQNHTLFEPTLHIRGKALDRKASKLLTLFKEMATSTDFTDIPRLKELILKHYTGLESSLNSSALKYAINLSASGLDVASKIGNEWYGLEYFWTLRRIAQDFDKYSEKLVDQLVLLKSKLLGLDQPHLVLTSDIDIYQELKSHHFYGLTTLETHPYTPWRGDYPLESVQPQGRVITSPLAFIGQVLKTISYVHPDAPALSVASGLFDNLILHKKIREEGGAYGGGAVNNSLLGNFYFYSYRDPNIASSIHTFEEAIREISKGHFSESDLEEAKLEIIQGLDDPVAPGSRGDYAYGWFREGKTHEIRQSFRNRLLALTRGDVIRAIKEHLLPQISSSATVVFASRDLLEKENAILTAHGKPPLPIKSI